MMSRGSTFLIDIFPIQPKVFRVFFVSRLNYRRLFQLKRMPKGALHWNLIDILADPITVDSKRMKMRFILSARKGN